MDRAPAFAGPDAGHANPTGRVLITFVVAVPMKMHPYPAMLVSVNLFARRSGDHGGLRPMDGRPGGDTLATELLGDRQGGQFGAVIQIAVRLAGGLKRP